MCQRAMHRVILSRSGRDNARGTTGAWGDHAGLKNYGVNFIRVLPGGQSSARHAHSKQDEFVYVIEGEFVLVTDAGRETVGPGHALAFRQAPATDITS
jgi:uncharacterized cupin superfamily protein